LRVVLRAVAINTRFLAWSAFAIGFTLYFVLNIGLVLLRIQARSTPIKVDDAYVYIIKAVQMVTCFRQSCAALEDLRPQLTIPSTDPETAWVRYREYGRAFLVYHPLHSALVVLLRAVGLSWEGAYEGIRLAGSVFICTVMPYWLVTLWGPGPAGIALALLAFMFFHDQGLHYVVPSNLALGIAMLVWARISARDGAAEWSLALGTLAMVTMHPIGRLYAIASVSLFLLFAARRPWTKSRLAGVLFSVSIVTLSFVLPFVVSRPELTVRADPPLAGWPRSWYGILGYGLLSNFGTIDGAVKNWIALYGGIASAAIITALGFLSLPRVERSAVVKNSLVLVGLLIVSAVYVLPRYPADLFQRVWIPIVILLTGATGQVAWILLVGAFSHFVSDQRDMSSPITRLSTGFSALSSIPNWVLALIITVAIFIAVRIETGIGQGVRDMKAQARAMREDPWALDPVQPKLMLTQARLSDIVLYLDEVPMHFYFTHGALETRAIYYPALVDPSGVSFLDPGRPTDSPRIYQPVTVDALAETEWLRSENLRYLVGWSPITYVKTTNEAMVPMSAFNSIEYSSPAPVSLNNGRVYLINSGKEATLQVIYTSENTTRSVQIPVPRAWSGWLALSEGVSSSALRTFRLKIDRTDAEVYMKGMSFGNTKLNWPWDQRATLVFHTGDEEGRKTMRFDPDELLPVQGLHVSVKILNDSGSTVLSELVRTSSTSGHHPLRAAVP
jgi:hypothetical protein